MEAMTVVPVLVGTSVKFISEVHEAEYIHDGESRHIKLGRLLQSSGFHDTANIAFQSALQFVNRGLKSSDENS